MSARPLDGITVCDFTVALSGPMATLALAQLGARVIKVERPRDPAREAALIGGVTSAEIVWASRHGGKESTAIDLRSVEGIEVAKELIRRSDVVVENFRPGSIERLGLGYESVRPLNPRMIYASLTGYSADSEWASFGAYDPQAQAISGVTSVTGVADRPPTRPGAPLSDITSGIILAEAVVAALVQRKRSGEGQRVSISMVDTSLHFMRSLFAAYVVGGELPVRRGNLPTTPTLYDFRHAFRCLGGGESDYCLLEMTTEHDWTSVLRLTELESLSEDPRFYTPELRVRNESQLAEILSPWFLERPKREAMLTLLSAGVSAAAVMTPHDLVHDPGLRAADTFVNLAFDDGSSVKSLAWPVKFVGTPPTLSPGPGLGQHTDEVLRQVLGYSADRIRTLREAGVVA